MDAAYYKFASGPEALPKKFFMHVGRTAVVADVGGGSVSLRLLVHLIGYNFMALMTALTAATTADYKNNLEKTSLKKEDSLKKA